jgi:hypothetical protein
MLRNGTKLRAVLFGGITLAILSPQAASATVFEFDEAGNVTAKPSLNFMQRARSSASRVEFNNVPVRRELDLRGSVSSTISLPSNDRDGGEVRFPAEVASLPATIHIPQRAITFVELGTSEESARLPLKKPHRTLGHNENDWSDEAIDIATKNQIPPSVFIALIDAESGFNPKAISPKGAIGLTQLMPATATALGVDPFDPKENLTGGARYLRQQYERFGTWNLALAAYNAGPTRVAQLGRIPNIPETRAFVTRVLKASGLDSKPTTTASN